MMQATPHVAHETPITPATPSGSDAADQKMLMRENLRLIGTNRDEAAFAEVYDYFAGRVKSFLIGKGMNEDSAEELMQEIMLIVWRRAESYDPEKAAASTWIFTIARNRRIDFLRGKQRIEVELDDEILELESTERDIQEKHVASAQAAALLSEALDALPLEQRQVVHLSYFRGQSHGAIANWLGLPVGTVKSRIRLAMQAVRSQFIAKDFEH